MSPMFVTQPVICITSSIMSAMMKTLLRMFFLCIMNAPVTIRIPTAIQSTASNTAKPTFSFVLVSASSVPVPFRNSAWTYPISAIHTATPNTASDAPPGRNMISAAVTADTPTAIARIYHPKSPTANFNSSLFPANISSMPKKKNMNEGVTAPSIANGSLFFRVFLLNVFLSSSFIIFFRFVLEGREKKTQP